MIRALQIAALSIWCLVSLCLRSAFAGKVNQDFTHGMRGQKTHSGSFVPEAVLSGSPCEFHQQSAASSQKTGAYPV